MKIFLCLRSLPKISLLKIFQKTFHGVIVYSGGAESGWWWRGELSKHFSLFDLPFQAISPLCPSNHFIPQSQTNSIIFLMLSSVTNIVPLGFDQKH